MRLSAHGDNGGIAAAHLGSRTATPVTIDPDAHSILRAVGSLCASVHPSARRDRVVLSSSSRVVQRRSRLYTLQRAAAVQVSKQASKPTSEPASQPARARCFTADRTRGFHGYTASVLASLREMSPIFRITSSDIPLRFSLSAMDYFARLLLSSVLFDRPRARLRSTRKY